MGSAYVLTFLIAVYPGESKLGEGYGGKSLYVNQQACDDKKRELASALKKFYAGKPFRYSFHASCEKVKDL